MLDCITVPKGQRGQGLLPDPAKIPIDRQPEIQPKIHKQADKSNKAIASDRAVRRRRHMPQRVLHDRLQVCTGEGPASDCGVQFQ